MTTIQRSTVIALGLLLGGGVLAPVGAHPMPAASGRLSLSGAAMQLADASQSWAIRPADETDSPMQSTDAAVRPSTSSSHAESLAIQTDGGIRYVSGGVGDS
jgi:hypothetical protein